MRNLHIIMPMAGEGSRFLKEGWNTPKPLIELQGIPLFMHAINSVKEKEIPMKYSFIVRQEHIDRFRIDDKIKSYLPDANIFAIRETTRGAVETCLFAQPTICEDDSILVMDCDLEFSSTNFMEHIKRILKRPVNAVSGGLLVSFESKLTKYSYAQVDKNNIVKRTAEKEAISSHALCGAYFFSSANIFLKAANQLLANSDFDKPEFYVSLLYNHLLNDHQIVRLCAMEQYHSYGTPEEIRKYL